MLFNSLYLNFENAGWIFNKEKIKEQNLSSIASHVSDKVFNLTPIIHNELIVRDRISSMSMSGSVNLLKLGLLLSPIGKLEYFTRAPPSI